MPTTLPLFRSLPDPVQVMLLAARPRQSSAERTELDRLCTPQLDWARLLQLAAHHSLLSLIHAGLNRCCPRQVPPEVAQALQRGALNNTVHAFHIMREAARVSGALAHVHQPTVVLKGVPLSAQLYGRAHLRQVGDLDLLLMNDPDVRTADALIATLDDLGYQRINPVVELTPRRLGIYLRFWKDFTFRHRDHGTELDLHWRLFNHTSHPANRLLPANPRPLTALGVTVDVLPPGHQFLHVVAHGVSDAWVYLKSLADVAGLLATLSPAEFEDAIDLAAQVGLLPQVSAAVHLSRAWMGSTAPHSRLLPPDHAFVALFHSQCAGLLLARDFQPTRDGRTPAEWVRLERTQVHGASALAENIRRFLWRPRVWQQFNLPDWLFWLYPALGLALLPRAASLFNWPEQQNAQRLKVQKMSEQSAGRN